MSFSTLSSGSIERMLTENETGKPVVQVLGSKCIKGQEGNDRWRLLVSDGKHLHSFAMLASQLNQFVTGGKLVNNTIIKVLKHTVSVINPTDPINKRVLIILDLDVLHAGEDVGKQIGNATLISATNVSANIENTKPNGGSGASSSSSAAAGGGPLHNKPKETSFGGGGGSSSAMNQSVLSDSLTHPISSLSPYQNKWVIKARVTNKSQIRTWNNAKGEGQLFSMDLLDESGEIRATAFRDMVDKYYDMIKVGKVYFISKCQLKPANKNFSNLRNDYEMTFSSDTLVQECDDTDADSSIPTIQYDFVPISSVAQLEQNSIVDIAGVCVECSEVQQFTARASGKELKKRDVVLADASRASVSLTLWGDDAVNFVGAIDNPVVVVKGARITEFGGGKSVSVSQGGMMLVNPNVPEGLKLRSWYDNGGASQVGENVSAKTGAGSGFRTEWLTFYEAKEKKLGFGEKPDYFQIKGNIHLIKAANALYHACPQQDCNKKVVDQGNGTYRCEKCNNDYPNFKYRMLMNMVVGDWSGSDWATCFTESAEKVLGKTSQEVGLMLEQKESEDNFFALSHFNSFVFKFRVKNEFYGDSYRTKMNVVNVEPVNYKQYNEYLVNNLKRMTGLNTTN